MKERSRYITVDPDISSDSDPNEEKEMSKFDIESYTKG